MIMPVPYLAMIISIIVMLFVTFFVTLRRSHA